MPNKLYRLCRHLLAVALSGAWLFLFTVALSATAPSAPFLREAAQANATAVQNLSEFLNAQATRSEEATRFEREVIQHALTVFTWIVGVVGALLVAGAALLGWAMAAWSRASKTDIEMEVKKQLPGHVTEVIEKEIKATRDRIGKLDEEAGQVAKELEEAKGRVAGTEDQLREQGDTITKLYALALGAFPYNYLKSIYDKKTGTDPNQEFILQEGSSFKREINFLIDLGYLENIDLSRICRQLKYSGQACNHRGRGAVYKIPREPPRQAAYERKLAERTLTMLIGRAAPAVPC